MNRGASDEPGVADTQVPATRRVGGRYQLIALLGEGGMGSVYRAFDEILEETVALKMLRRDVLEIPGILERFKSEVRLARRVTHPNVARTFELGHDQGALFLTVEHIAGPTLRAVLREAGALSIERAEPIVAGICAGLEAAHGAGVIHRDIKPDNVMIPSESRPVITDFGIARALGDQEDVRRTASPIGTPAYMAPEQVTVGEITAKTDLYALGVMLYEVLTGRLPWRAPTTHGMLIERLSGVPVDVRALAASVPPDLAELISRCLATDPNQRPERAAEIAETLARASRGETRRQWTAVTTPKATEAPRSRVLAILPFESSSSDEDVAVARGLSEELVDSICHIRGLRVLSARMVARAAREHSDPLSLGRELGAHQLGEGSVRRTSAGFRVSVRLVESTSGHQLWAGRFESAPEQLGDLADRIAVEIARALSVEAQEPAGRSPMSVDAFELYLRARDAHRRYAQTEAITLFERALERAPAQPEIMSGLAAAIARGAFILEGDARESLDRARDLAQRALDAAPQLGEAHFALAVVLLHQGEPIEAAGELRAAIERSPSFGEAQGLLGELLLECGRVQDGLQRLRVALELDRELMQVRLAQARAHALGGAWDRVRALADAIPYGVQVRFATWKKDRGWLEELSAQMPPDGLALNTGMARAFLGTFFRTESAEQAEKHFEIAPNPRISARRRLLIDQLHTENAALLGDPGRALDALDRAVAGGLIDLLWLDRCPTLDPLRERSRFVAARAAVQARVDAMLERIWG